MSSPANSPRDREEEEEEGGGGAGNRERAEASLSSSFVASHLLTTGHGPRRTAKCNLSALQQIQEAHSRPKGAADVCVHTNFKIVLILQRHEL